MATPSKRRFRPGDSPSVGPSHPIADAITIERARSGDEDAIAEIWRIYQPQVLRLLRAKSCDSPDDVASQVWIDVGRAIATFEGDGVGLQRWIFTIASHRSTDDVRRIRRRREVPLDRTPDVAAPPDPTGSLENALALIATLPPPMAEAVMLRVVHDLAVPTVAAITGTTEGNVRLLVHRGLARLRSTFDDDEPADDRPDRV